MFRRRLRRDYRYSPFPMAAEVLEVRQLLSAGAVVAAATNPVQTAANNGISQINTTLANTKSMQYYNNTIVSDINKLTASGNPVLQLKAPSFTAQAQAILLYMQTAATTGINNVNGVVTQYNNSLITSSQAMTQITQYVNTAVTSINGFDQADLSLLKALDANIQTALKNPPGTISKGPGPVNGILNSTDLGGEATGDWTLKFPHVAMKDGTKFTVNLNTSSAGTTTTGTIGKISGTLNAKIINITDTGNDPGQPDDIFTVTLAPTGGKMELNFTLLDGKSKKITIKPDGSDFTLTVDAKGDVSELTGNYILPVIKGFTNGGEVFFDLHT
jgi:hypothetical protein